MPIIVIVKIWIGKSQNQWKIQPKQIKIAYRIQSKHREDQKGKIINEKTKKYLLSNFRWIGFNKSLNWELVWWGIG